MIYNFQIIFLNLDSAVWFVEVSFWTEGDNVHQQIRHEHQQKVYRTRHVDVSLSKWPAHCTNGFRKRWVTRRSQNHDYSGTTANDKRIPFPDLKWKMQNMPNSWQTTNKQDFSLNFLNSSVWPENPIWSRISSICSTFQLITALEKMQLMPLFDPLAHRCIVLLSKWDFSLVKRNGKCSCWKRASHWPMCAKTVQQLLHLERRGHMEQPKSQAIDLIKPQRPAIN